MNLRFQIYRDIDSQWRWRLIAGNNRILATSGEGYINKGDVMSAIDLVKSSNLASFTSKKLKLQLKHG
jgi:uncharacterized protein YegP (UPF0339 family)